MKNQRKKLSIKNHFIALFTCVPSLKIQLESVSLSFAQPFKFEHVSIAHKNVSIYCECGGKKVIRLSTDRLHTLMLASTLNCGVLNDNEGQIMDL